MSTATLDMPAKKIHRDGEGLPLVGVDRIVLTGFMGSGKTSVGALLAKRLGWRFVDLDGEVERRDGRSVPRIFEESGEGHFRRLETAALAALLGQRGVVLALGGGSPEELGNRLLLEQTPHTAVVFLDAPYEILLDRCRVQAADPAATARPVLADPVTAAGRFHLRRPHYERIASHRVDTSQLGLEEVLGSVLQTLTTGRILH